jgi:hypothetical protein
MTTDDDLDRQIQAYLESGPAELADRVLWAARAQLRTTRRRRARFAWLMPWRDHPMNQSTRLLLAGGGTLALVVAIGAGVFGTSPKSDVGQNPSIGASPSPSAAAPTIRASSAPVAASSAKTMAVYPAIDVGTLTPAWTTSGGKASMLGIPEVAPDGRIWVASCTDDAFRILTPAGKLAETWGPAVGDPNHFKLTLPTGQCGGAVAFGPDGGFWVLDYGNLRVIRFDRDRTFIESWGRFGSGEGEFVQPNDIAVDGEGSIFVADEGGRKVEVFTSSGVHVRSVAAGHGGAFVSAHANGWIDTSLLPDGRPGLTEYAPDGSIQGGIDMPDLMPRPLGIARDGRGNLYVVGLTLDDAPSTLVRFNETGSSYDAWNAGGIALTVSPTGDVAYVLSATAESVTKYELPAP